MSRILSRGIAGVGGVASAGVVCVVVVAVRGGSW